MPNTGAFTFELTEEERDILRGYLPNSPNGTLRYLLYSNGGNWVHYVDKKLTLSDDIIPTATVTVTDTAGHFGKYGKYVQGQSKLKIDISAKGVHGSTIKSYQTTVDGKTYTGSNIQTDVIAGKSALDLEVTVTDSRERQVVIKQSLDVYEYKRPKILSLKSKRCQQHSTGVAGDKHLGVLFESEVTALDSRNTAKYEIAYKKITEDSYTVMTLDKYNNQYSVQGNAIFPADKDAYNIILRITDDFVTVEKKITGPSISVLMSKLRYNLGLAFGKLAELEGVFDIGFKTRFSGGILQDVLDDGKELNELVTPNIYLVDSARAYLNAPEDNVNAVLRISGNESFLKQRFEVISKTQPRVYERARDTDGYGEWVRACSSMEWTPCTITANDNAGYFYINSGRAWYRYGDTFLEICLTGSYVTKANVSERTVLCTVSGLDIAIPDMEVNIPIWDDTGQVWCRVELRENGDICLNSDASVPAQHWLGFQGLTFHLVREKEE